jgi:RNA-binding protein YhbY
MDIAGFFTAKTIPAKAAEQTGASLVEVRGHVFILYRRRKKNNPKMGKSGAFLGDILQGAS